MILRNVGNYLPDDMAYNIADAFRIPSAPDMAPVLVRYDLLQYVWRGCESKHCIKREFLFKHCHGRCGAISGRGGTRLWSDCIFTDRPCATAT